MASELDPFIRAKLLAFRARFRGLVFVRGLCSGLLAFLGGLLILSLFDYFIVMEDRARHALSGGMYLATIIVTWLVCIRPLLRVLEERELAAMMEREEPLLKSKLLSAVELSEEEGERESKLFRQQAQQVVIEDLRGLEMDRLMPAKLVQTWLVAVAVLIVATGLMAAFQSGRTLLMRALVPMANIDRVSRNKVLVLAPEGGNAAVPENDEIQIRIQVRGPKIKAPPYLMAERQDEQVQKAFFARAIDSDSKDEYTTTIAVESKNITYRVHAGDAVSRRYTLESRERPQVVQYEKTYVFPEYTGQSPRTGKEEHGNLSALTDTKVKLTLHLNQSVQTAVMHHVTESATNKLNFVQGIDSKQWQLELPLSENGAYKVHLTTAEKLSNKSPVEYSIEANPDLVPTVELSQPGAELTVRPEDIIPIVGEVKDDIGLARWEQLFKVNQADWKPIHTNLYTKPLTTNAMVRFDCDLLKRKVKPGDLVLTKLAVIDRKGSRTESRPIRIKVDSALFEANRIASLVEQRQWVDRLKQATAKALAFHKVLAKDLEGLIIPGRDADRRAKADEALLELDEAKNAWGQVWGGLSAVIGKARQGREASGLRLMGRLGVRMEADWFPRARIHLVPLQGIVVDPGVKAHLKHLPVVLKKIHSTNTDLQNTAISWLAADEAAVALDLLDYIQRAAENMHRVAKADKDTDVEVWTRLARRQASAGKELDVAEDVLKKLEGRVPVDQREVIGALHDDLQKIHETLAAKHAEGIKPDRTLLTTGLLWSQAISDSRDILRPLTHELGEKSAQAREKLESSVGNAAGSVLRLTQALEANELAKAKLAEAKKDGENVLMAKAAVNVTGELMEQEWIVAQGILRGRARIEEAGKASNALFVSDTAQAAIALGAIHEGMEAGRDLKEVKKQLEAIAEALATLEVAHELALLENAVKSLANRERWEHKSTDANTLRPRDWGWFSRKLSLSPKKLRAAGLAGEGKLNDLVRGAAAKAVAREMNQRQTQAGFFVEPNENKPSN